jgi:hypothetical protein
MHFHASDAEFFIRSLNGLRDEDERPLTSYFAFNIDSMLCIKKRVCHSCVQTCPFGSDECHTCNPNIFNFSSSSGAFLCFRFPHSVRGMPLSPAVCLVSTGVFEPIALAFRCESCSESRRSNLINCSWISFSLAGVASFGAGTGPTGTAHVARLRRFCDARTPNGCVPVHPLDARLLC